MAIKLKTDSWHYRFFDKNFPHSSPPKSLCPYFWILVGLMVLYPFIKGAEIVMALGNAFGKLFSPKIKPEPYETFEEKLERWKAENERERRKQERMEKIGKLFGKFLFYVVLPLAMIFLLVYIWVTAQRFGWYDVLIAIGITIAGTASFVSLLYLIDNANTSWDNSEWGQKINIRLSKIFDGVVKVMEYIVTPLKWIGWMIKASYEKACPIVEWEDNKVKEDKEL